MNKSIRVSIGIAVVSVSLAAPLALAATVGFGLAAKYPDDTGIKGDPDVVMFSDFEQSDWANDWSYTHGNFSAIGSDSNLFQPLKGKALRVTIPAGSNLGMDSGFKFAQKLGYEPEEIYFRYYVRFGDDWRPSWDGKLPGFGGRYGSGGWGGNITNGSNGWSARGLFSSGNNPILVGNYVYHADMGSWGEHFLWKNENLGHLQKNRWYSVEQFVKLNTPGARDGILRGWVDGKLAYERTNLRFRDIRSLKIEEIWLNVYHGGDATAPSTMRAYIDNLVVAKRYIGPMGTVRVPSAPVLSVM